MKRITEIPCTGHEKITKILWTHEKDHWNPLYWSWKDHKKSVNSWKRSLKSNVLVMKRSLKFRNSWKGSLKSNVLVIKGLLKFRAPINRITTNPVYSWKGSLKIPMYEIHIKRITRIRRSWKLSLISLLRVISNRWLQ